MKMNALQEQAVLDYLMKNAELEAKCNIEGDEVRRREYVGIAKGVMRTVEMMFERDASQTLSKWYADIVIYKIHNAKKNEAC